MHSKKAIYERLVTMMEELFEVESGRVFPEALLGEDLGIDSIDAVDMAAELQKITGQKIKPAAFKDIRTVQDLVDAAYAVLGDNDVAVPG
ncbi:MAG: acyl carrier protein [Halioglobus sp.]